MGILDNIDIYLNSGFGFRGLFGDGDGNGTGDGSEFGFGDGYGFGFGTKLEKVYKKLLENLNV